MINQSSARRREPQRASAYIELCHELCVESDVVLEEGWIGDTPGSVLSEREFVTESTPDVDEFVTIAVGESAFERGAELTALGAGLVVRFELCLNAIAVHPKAVWAIAGSYSEPDVSLLVMGVAQLCVGVFDCVLGLDVQFRRRKGTSFGT
eukprot:6183471-Pleurochrysis_carterae.AAC.8